MQPHQRTFLIVLIAFLVLACAGLLITSDSGNRAINGPDRQAGPQSEVDLQPIHTAQALAPLASGPDEQGLARDALRLADHEIDIAFTSALEEAAAQPHATSPEIRAILERIGTAKKSIAEMDAEIARLTKLVASASENQKTVISRQLDLANARQELNEDELADANEDLTRAGGDPQSRIKKMVDEHNAASQDSGGHLDLSVVGSRASSRVPTSNSFLARGRAWYALRSDQINLAQARQESIASASALTKRHDELQSQIAKTMPQPAKIQDLAPTVKNSEETPGTVSSPASDTTNATLSSLHSLSLMQRNIAGLDRRIQDEQNLANIYGSWDALVASLRRGLLHGLIASITWMLLIVLVVFAFDRAMSHFFDRLNPDHKNLLTLHAVVNIAVRAAGAVVILAMIFGLPSQIGTLIGLVGAGLTVALKDFIVGFFGWFALMRKGGIRLGDWVEINGVSGEVVEIGLFQTVLLETGNWNESGHPTGRRVTFVNSYAIEGHYFNFSTSGQWLWDELQIALPADQDPQPIVEDIQKIVTKETEVNAHLAEKEWAHLGNAGGARSTSAGPATSIRPANLGFEILVRYVTRANERYQQRSKLYNEIVELLRRKNISQPAQPPPVAPSAASKTA
jgi:small-conductance mechanosensitive channel